VRNAGHCAPALPRARRPGRAPRVVVSLAGALEPPHLPPSPASSPSENFRRLPTLSQDLGGLQLPALGFTEQPEGPRSLRQTACAPDPDPERDLPLPLCPYQQDDLPPPTGLPPLLAHTHLTASATRVTRSHLGSSITKEPPFVTKLWAKNSQSRRDQGLC